MSAARSIYPPSNKVSERQPRLDATHISIARQTTQILDNVDIDVHRGEFLGLVGPNGAGKSTLISVLAGLDAPDHGNVFVDGININRISLKQRAQKMALLEQLSEIHWPVSVERLVALGRLPHLQGWQKLNDADMAVVHQALLKTDCLQLKDRAANTLSGGEQSLVLLARVLASEPEILFADEPIAALDLGHQLQTMELLRNFAACSSACVAVLHDLSLAARFCDRLILLHHGRVVADGTPKNVLTDENLARVYGVEVISGDTEVPWMVPLKRLV